MFCVNPIGRLGKYSRVSLYQSRTPKLLYMEPSTLFTGSHSIAFPSVSSTSNAPSWVLCATPSRTPYFRVVWTKVTSLQYTTINGRGPRPTRDSSQSIEPLLTAPKSFSSLSKTLIGTFPRHRLSNRLSRSIPLVGHVFGARIYGSALEMSSFMIRDGFYTSPHPLRRMSLHFHCHHPVRGPQTWRSPDHRTSQSEYLQGNLAQVGARV